MVKKFASYKRATQSGPKKATQSGPTTKTSWTIMLYIAADGILANFAVESLRQLSRSASTARGKDDQASVVVESHTGSRLNQARRLQGRAFSNTHLMRQFEPEYVSFSTGLRNLIVGIKSL